MNHIVIKINENFFLFSKTKHTLIIFLDRREEMMKFMIVEPWQCEGSTFVKEFGKMYGIVYCLFNFIQRFWNCIPFVLFLDSNKKRVILFATSV